MADDSRPPRRDGGKPRWKKRAPPGEGREFKRDEGRDFKRGEGRDFKRDGDRPHWKKRAPGEGRDFKRGEGRDFKRDGDRPRRFERDGDKPHWKKRPPGEGRDFKRDEGRDFKRDEGRDFKRGGDRPHWKKRAPGEGREFKRGEGRDFKGGGGFKRDGDRPRRFGDKGGKPHWKKRGDERAEESFHQRDLVRVAGLTAVKALFAASPERVERLFFAAEMKDAAQGYCRILAHSRKVFRETPAEELDRIAGSPMHGGIVAVARPKPINPFDPDAARRWVKDTPLLPILHGVGNPHNLGAIARTAAFLGLPRLVISDHPAQARLSDAAFRVAEGGFEFIEIFRATDLPGALKRLSESFRVVGTGIGRGATPDRIPRDKPIALVLGNEETGLDAAILAACDEVVTIEGAGAVQSLNVSVAAGILLHALRPSSG